MTPNLLELHVHSDYLKASMLIFTKIQIITANVLCMHIFSVLSPLALCSMLEAILSGRERIMHFNLCITLMVSLDVFKFEMQFECLRSSKQIKFKSLCVQRKNLTFWKQVDVVVRFSNMTASFHWSLFHQETSLFGISFQGLKMIDVCIVILLCFY